MFDKTYVERNQIRYICIDLFTEWRLYILDTTSPLISQVAFQEAQVAFSSSQKSFICFKKKVFNASSQHSIYNLCIGLLLLAAYCYIVVTLLLLHYCWHLSDGNTLVICQHHVHSHPLTAFSSKKSDRLTRHQGAYHGIIIFLWGLVSSSSSSSSPWSRK